MNALPVRLELAADPQSRSQYFGRLEELGFDVAYVTFSADEYYSEAERFRQVYTDFAADARSLGYPVCGHVSSSDAPTDIVGAEEAQYDDCDRPIKLQTGTFLPSPASDAWKDRLKELITLCVRDLDFDWVVVEEPEFRVDVPGPKDRFAAKFAARFLEIKYPPSRDESTEYLTVQQAKADTIQEFVVDLVAHARSVGAKKVGVMPQVFLPGAQARADRVARTACDLAQLAQMSDVDFLVSRMKPNEVRSGAVVIPKDAKRAADACRIEAAAHLVAKPVMVTASPLTDAAKAELLPIDFYRDSLLSMTAACPTGFVAQGYEHKVGVDEPHWQLASDMAGYLGRLGRPQAQVAFVFSDSAARHAPPFDYGTVFEHYWSFAEHMGTEAQVPMLTFHASSLRQSLADHPEVRVLLFEEHFPLTVEQIVAIRDWWQGPERRAIIAFGFGLGLSADANCPGARTMTEALPGVLEFVGLRQEADQPEYVSDEPIKVRNVSRVRRSAFLGDSPPAGLRKLANVRRVFGSRAIILYEADIEEIRIPIAVEWKDRTTLAIFCGFGLTSETAQAASLAVRYALHECDASPPIITDCTEGLLWNLTEHGYVVISNISDKKLTAVGRPGRNTFWDCAKQQMLPQGDPRFTIDPHSFQVYRVVGRRSKFFDVKGVCRLDSLVDGAGRADIELVAGKTTTLILRAPPKEIMVDGRPSAITDQLINNAYHVTLQQCPPGERKISLRW